MIKLPLSIFFFASVFLSPKTVNSQGYYHSPNDTLEGYVLLDDLINMNITQVHTDNSTIQFHWELVEATVPSGWDINICDNANCYTSLESSGTTLPILPGDDGLILIHCTPHTTEGTATVRYSIYELGNPTQLDTLVWIIHSSQAGIAEKDNHVNAFVKGSELYFTGNVEQFNMGAAFSSDGQQVARFTPQKNIPIDLGIKEHSFCYIVLNGTNKQLILKTAICIE